MLGPKPEAGAPLKPGLQPRHYKSDGTPVIDLGDDNRATVALGPNDESVRCRCSPRIGGTCADDPPPLGNHTHTPHTRLRLVCLQIIFPLYTTEAGLGGVHSASTTDGSRNWRYLSTEDSQCVIQRARAAALCVFRGQHLR